MILIPHLASFDEPPPYVIGQHVSRSGHTWVITHIQHDLIVYRRRTLWEFFTDVLRGWHQ